MSAIPNRDTDTDWRHIGRTEPFWGVLGQSHFKRENLDDAALEQFHASGRHNVDDLIGTFERLLGRTPRLRSALDFGCGVGRLSEAMTRYADKVTGYDIAPGMLEVARRRSGGVRYVDALPDERFDWINAIMVFQHVPPPRGLAQLGSLLDTLEPGGLVSLHFTIWREPPLRPRAPGWRARLRPPRPPIGSVAMYDYDLSAVVERLNTHGIGTMMLTPTDHGGHHGVIMFGQRSTSQSERA